MYLQCPLLLLAPPRQGNDCHVHYIGSVWCIQHGNGNSFSWSYFYTARNNLHQQLTPQGLFKYRSKFAEMFHFKVVPPFWTTALPIPYLWSLCMILSKSLVYEFLIVFFSLCTTADGALFKGAVALNFWPRFFCGFTLYRAEISRLEGF
jgi:hypothetical protein